MKKLFILFFLFCAFLVLFNNNLSIRSKTQQYPEQQSAQNIKLDEFRNMWWLKAAYYDLLESGVTPYNSRKAYFGIASLYFYDDSVWVWWNFHENWKTKYIKSGIKEFNVLSPSGDGTIDFSVRISSSSSDTILEIYQYSIIKKWESFKKYPVKYWFKPPPVGLINENFFVGRYVRLDSSSSKIIFTLDGRITGLENHTNYKVVYDFEDIANYDTIVFSNIDTINKYKQYYSIYHWKCKRETLEFYSEIDNADDTYSIGQLYLKLLRISR